MTKPPPGPNPGGGFAVCECTWSETEIHNPLTWGVHNCNNVIMETKSLTDVRRDLVTIIDHIKVTGDSLIITDYGRPVAMIGPPPSDVVAVASTETNSL